MYIITHSIWFWMAHLSHTHTQWLLGNPLWETINPFGTVVFVRISLVLFVGSLVKCRVDDWCVAIFILQLNFIPFLSNTKYQLANDKLKRKQTGECCGHWKCGPQKWCDHLFINVSSACNIVGGTKGRRFDSDFPVCLLVFGGSIGC